MSNHQDSRHVFPIFQGDNANNQGKGSGAATPRPAYDGDEALVTQILKSGSSTYGRPYKAPHCKAFNSEAGCPYGDNCIYIHDERVTTRESLAVVVAPGLCGTGPLPLATSPRGLTVSSGAMKPLFYRTKICNKWQQAGYCNYGSKCHFAHGEAELRKYSGRGPNESEASLNNQRAVVQNLPAANRPFPGSGVKAAAPGNAGWTRQVAGAVQGPIPIKNAWKVPKKINGIYGDWIDGHDID